MAKLGKIPLNARIDYDVKTDMDKIRNELLLPHEDQEDYVNLAIHERNQRLLKSEFGGKSIEDIAQSKDA